MTNNFVRQGNLSDDAIFDNVAKKIHFESVITGTGSPVTPPSLTAKRWLYVDRSLTPAILWLWDPSVATWVQVAEGAGTAHTHPATAVSTVPATTGLDPASTDVEKALTELAARPIGVGSGSPVKSGGVGSDHWFNPPGCAGGTLSIVLLSANSVFYIPWFTPVDIVITAVAVRCTTLAASSLIRAGIASVDSSMQPLALVNEFSTFDTTSTGVKSYTGLSVAIPAGRYVTAVKAEGGNPAMVYSPIVAGPSAGFYATFSSGGGTAASFHKTTSPGAYTNPPPAWDSVSGSFSFLFMRWVSA